MDKLYCLDTNVLIQAWSKYYAQDICPKYWETLSLLGAQGKIFIPQDVYDEIVKIEDDLAKWLKTSGIPVRKKNEAVVACLSAIYDADPLHEKLVDATHGRSLADPWVIAHAMDEGAIVVTKENEILGSSKKIKIPNVCKKMGVPCIDDFQFIREVGITFDCCLPKLAEKQTEETDEHIVSTILKLV